VRFNAQCEVSGLVLEKNGVTEWGRWPSLHRASEITTLQYSNTPEFEDEDENEDEDDPRMPGSARITPDT